LGGRLSFSQCQKSPNVSAAFFANSLALNAVNLQSDRERQNSHSNCQRTVWSSVAESRPIIQPACHFTFDFSKLMRPYTAGPRACVPSSP